MFKLLNEDLSQSVPHIRTWVEHLVGRVLRTKEEELRVY